MNQAIRDSQEKATDHLNTRSGSLKLDDDDRVYVSVGDVIADKYRVERVLGVGGMGFVVAATHVQLEGTFALKFLKKRYLQDGRVVDRFTREAKAACRIRSDFVARVFDVGVVDGAPFLVMEHLVGRDLAAVLAEQGRLSVEDAVEYTVQACAALAAAHACGVVHRDIKPENLFLIENGGVCTVKLLDFGISRIALTAVAGDAQAARLTGALTLGTPLYMSPEQIRSTASADARSDLWSLGVVLHELLTGAAPFLGESLHEICATILEREPPYLLQSRPDAPVGLADIVERCLRKEPADRYRSVSELAVALLGFAPARSLAVAEGSPSIRRAAIQALGLGAEGPPRSSPISLGSISVQGPVSSARPASMPELSLAALPSTDVTMPPSVTIASARNVATVPPLARPHSNGKSWFAGMAGLVVAAAVVTLAIRVGLAPGERRDSRSEGLSSAAALPAVPSPAVAMKDLPTPPAIAERALADAAPEPRPSRFLPPTTRGPSQQRWTPPQPSAPAAPPSRAASAPASRPSAASSTALIPEPLAPPPPAAPPLSPGRPDLGY